MTFLPFRPDVECPLDDVRVLDLSRFVAGNMFSLALADLGAEVIKVEQPGTGDPLKQVRIGGVPVHWKVYARNKKSITLNLRLEEGRQLLLKLAERSHILVENFVPGTMEKFGLGPDALLESNPKLVMVRISGWGQTGPYKHRPGFGTLAEAMSGFAFVNGFQDRPPVLPPMSLADMVAGIYGAMAALVALRHAEMHDGAGQVIDVPLYDPLFAIMGPEAATYKIRGRAKERGKDSNTVGAPRNVYQTKDGHWIAVSASTQLMAERFFKSIGREDLIDDPRFRTGVDRLKNQDELDAIFSEAYARRTLDENMAFILEHNLTAAPVYSIAQILDDPYVQDRQIVVELPDPEGEMASIPMHNVVPRLSGTPGAIRRPAPRLGEHNQEVYGELGLDSEAIARMVEAGVI